MTMTTRFLMWDGVYSSKGICNHNLPPIGGRPLSAFVDGSPEMVSLQKRLHWLGFYRGSFDGLRASTQHAINDFMAYPNLVVGTDIISRNPSEETVLGRYKKYDYPFNHEDFINRVGRLTGNRLIQGRLEAVNPPLDTSTGEGIGVQIDSTCSNFVPFSEVAGIRVNFVNIENIKSLMLRIYRQGSEDLDYVVYQEILTADDIAALSDLPLGASDKGTLLQETSEHMNYKRRHGNLTAMEFHAPYLIRIYISKEANTFNEEEKRFINVWNKIEATLLDNSFEMRDFQALLSTNNTVSILEVRRNYTHDLDSWSTTHTKTTAVSVNQIGQISNECKVTRTLDFSISLEEDENISKLKSDTYTTALDLLKQRTQKKFLSLRVIFFKAQRQIGELTLEVAYGRYAWMPRSLKDEVIMN